MSEADAQLTCFVVTGFGKKTDYATGRVLNLDQTFSRLVQPACDRANINCFRAIDANLTGQIDSVMYRWIFEADLVIADLSTLNANVFYELGVRHAQRPNTTVLIAEAMLLQRIPFDLSSFVIHQYDHGGEDISQQEQDRFVPHLGDLLHRLFEIEMTRRRTSPELPPESDSPVYRNLRDMTPPVYDPESYLEPPPYIPPLQRATAPQGENLADVLKKAEAAIRSKDFDSAITLLQMLVDAQEEAGVKPDVYIVQKLALATYKAGEHRDQDGTLDRDRAMSALHAAETLLERHCGPGVTTDPETLGLAGAINKRLHDLTGDLTHLDRAIGFYERGFHIKQDYYNGINAAFMYTLRATLLEDRFEAIVSYGHANMIRRQVAAICEDLLGDEEAAATRGDREWIFLTLAEAYFGMGRTAETERLERKIDAQASDFAKSSYAEQKVRLATLIAEFEHAAPPDEPSSRPVSKPSSQPAPDSPASDSPAPDSTGRITFRPDIAPGKSIRSIEVTYRVDYGDPPQGA